MSCAIGLSVALYENNKRIIDTWTQTATENHFASNTSGVQLRWNGNALPNATTVAFEFGNTNIVPGTNFSDDISAAMATIRQQAFDGDFTNTAIELFGESASVTAVHASLPAASFGLTAEFNAQNTFIQFVGTGPATFGIPGTHIQVDPWSVLVHYSHKDVSVLTRIREDLARIGIAVG